MKLKSLMLLGVAAVCGLVAMLGVQQAMSGSREPEVPKRKVLVATADITPSAPLDDTNSSFKDMPEGTIPEGAITDREQHQERGLKRGAFPGDVITLSKLGEKGQLRASMEIPDGMRVVTVSVNLTKTHSGLILPGDRVDVQVTYKARDLVAGMVTRTKTLLEYVKVFATDSVRDANNTENGEVHAKNISLLVTPEQANLLMLAESKGNLTLALRSKDDTKSVQTQALSEIDLDTLRIGRGNPDEPAEGSEAAEAAAGSEAPATGDVRSFLTGRSAQPVAAAVPAPEAESPPAVAPPKRTWTIEIFHGQEKRVEEIELPEETVSATTTETAAAGTEWTSYLKKMFPPVRTGGSEPAAEATR